jgi:hypothetical protein
MSDLRLTSRTFIALFLITSVVTPMIPVGSGWRAIQVASGGTESGNNADSSIGCFELVAASSESPSVVRCALEPKDDTYVDNLLPKKTFGHEFVLVVQNTPAVPPSENQAYLKFDLASTLPNEILMSQARPRNATLWLYSRFVTAFHNATVGVHYVSTNDWNESGLTWDIKPLFDPALFTSETIVTNETWYQWNVTQYVDSAMQKPAQISFAAVADTHWKNYVWFDSKDHPQTEASPTAPELVLYFVEPTLTVETPYPNIPITVEGGSSKVTVTGRLQVYAPWGDYKITVPEVISEGEGARAVFVGWNDSYQQATRTITVGNDATLRAKYQMQYSFNVTSLYGSTEGAGWYPKNTNVSLSVSPLTVPVGGFAGFLGAREVFDHWDGGCTSSQPECTVVMDGPKRATVVWKEDYMIPILALASIALVATIVLLFINRMRKRSSHP